MSAPDYLNAFSMGRRFRSHFMTGFAIGAFFSMMSASFAYEDPLARAQLTTTQKASEIFKEMGRNMYSSGKGFAKVGALFAGIECVIESVSLFTVPRRWWANYANFAYFSIGRKMT